MKAENDKKMHWSDLRSVMGFSLEVKTKMKVKPQITYQDITRMEEQNFQMKYSLSSQGE